MPRYDYFCSANGTTIEVKHCMSDLMQTWGELCAKAGMPVGETPAHTPVEKLLSGAYVATESRGGSCSGDHCCSGGSCCGGGCCH